VGGRGEAGVLPFVKILIFSLFEDVPCKFSWKSDNKKILKF